MPARWVSVFPSSPWSQENCFGQWRSKVWTADSTAWTNHYREKETQEIRLRISEADMNDPFGNFLSDKIKKLMSFCFWELTLGICHCSL